MFTYDKFDRKFFFRIDILWSTLFYSIFLLYHSTELANTIPDIIFTQLPQSIIKTDHDELIVFSPSTLYVKGCRIVSLLSSKMEPKNLTPEFYSASDPEISFDGKYIIFAGRKETTDNWQIWRMKADGSEKVQITREEGDCFMPVYAGNRFYLNDPTPTPQIIFVGTAHNWKNIFDSEPVYSLYGTDRNGEVVHRLTFNLYSDFSPNVLSNGRIVFTSLRNTDNNNPNSINMAFMSINNDGTDLMPYYGNHENPIYKNDIYLSDVNKVSYFIESDNPDFLGGGYIASLSQRRPLHSYKKITKSANGYFKNPVLISNKELIVSYRSDHKEDVYGLYTYNPNNQKEMQKIIETQGWHSLDAKILAPHTKVKGRSNWLIPGSKYGVFYCLNSYQSNIFEGADIEPGEYKFVRIIEGLPVLEHYTKISGNTTVTHGQIQAKRIIGIAPVEKDGSFNVRVPAETPISFQMLDENQMTISKQKSWTWVIGNENRGCIGCHENRELSPSNTLVDAITKPPVDLNTNNRERKNVDYQNQIAPLIVSKCATSECHVAGKATPNLSHSNNKDTYKTLIEPIRGRENEYYIKPGYAKSSPLIWHLLGKKLDSDNNVYSSPITQMPPEYPLTDEDKLIFIEWVDLGAQWTLSNYFGVKSEINSN